MIINQIELKLFRFLNKTIYASLDFCHPERLALFDEY